MDIQHFADWFPLVTLNKHGLPMHYRSYWEGGLGEGIGEGRRGDREEVNSLDEGVGGRGRKRKWRDRVLVGEEGGRN